MIDTNVLPLTKITKNKPVLIKGYSEKFLADTTSTLNKVLEFGFLVGERVTVRKSFNSVYQISVGNSTSDYAIDKYIAENILTEPLKTDTFTKLNV